MDQGHQKHHPIDILLVDDRPETLLSLTAALANPDYNLVTAGGPLDALRYLLDRDFALIVLDIQMPNMDGFELARLIRERERSMHTPIIFLTAAYQGEADMFRAYQVGAVDYILKPVVPDILRSKVAAFVALNRMQRELECRLEETRRLNRALEASNRALARSEAQLTELNRTLEQRVKQRTEALSFLMDAGVQLNASLDYDKALDTLIHLLVPQLADWCTVDMLQEDGTLQVAAALHSEPNKTAQVRELASELWELLPGKGAAEVLRTGKPELTVGITPELIQVQDEKQAARLCEVGIASRLIVPLVAHGKTIGTISLYRGMQEHNLDEQDLSLVEELARRAGMAIANGQLYRESQSAVQVRDHFLAVASHELKTPLTVISGYTELLRRMVQAAAQRTPENDAASDKLLIEQGPLERQIGNLQQASTRLTHLINDLLDINRMQTRAMELDLEELNLVDLFSHVVENFVTREQARQNGLKIASESVTTPILGRWDRGRIEQVLVNLIENAIKYSVEEKKVEVYLTVEQTDDGRGQAHIAVQDYGIGIPPDEQKRVFQPFMRASNASANHFPGLGLGLAICRQIVERHGGRIWAESDGPNQGSTFHVVLPIEKSENSSLKSGEQVLRQA